MVYIWQGDSVQFCSVDIEGILSEIMTLKYEENTLSTRGSCRQKLLPYLSIDSISNSESVNLEINLGYKKAMSP